MAISKERLKELIKECATIYYLEDKNVCLICLNKDFYIDQVYFGNTFEYWLYYQNIIYKPLNKLYETKKQAEWHLKYHATQTEELDLPMWEEISKTCGETFSYSFCRRNGCYITEYMLNVYTPLSIDIRMYDIDKNKNESICDFIFDEDFTEENYIKACDLCLKLFKGEENGI